MQSHLTNSHYKLPSQQSESVLGSQLSEKGYFTNHQNWLVKIT